MFKSFITKHKFVSDGSCDGIIALIARFRATKKRPTRVIARLYYKDLLFFKLQQCSFSLSHLSDKTYDQNNEKPRRESQKRFPCSLVYLKFLNKTCTSNVFAEFLLREFIRSFSRRKGASPVRLNVREDKSVTPLVC